MSKNLYMHTLDGKPATFDGVSIYQLFYTNRVYKIKVFSSLREIRKHQKLEQKHRDESVARYVKDPSCSNGDPSEYFEKMDYMLVEPHNARD